ncbi:MAG: YwbE family protein [Desulfobulbaceae bacterium]|nr:YwbE family protein [Desulfobulbaceae bacterium]
MTPHGSGKGCYTLVRNMYGINRKEIKPGMRVCIVLKEDQRSGKLTEGIVKDILTRSPTHPHGIKVRLESGQVGRVRKIDV